VTLTSDTSSAEPRRRGRPVGDRQARSGELIAAARAVIGREGYAAASLRKVAEEAGVSTGAGSYYFENKVAMVIAVAEALFDEFDAWLTAQGDACDPQSICESLLKWITQGGSEAWLVCLQLLVGARGEPALAEVIARRDGQFLANMTRLIERGQARGLIRRDFPADVLAEQLGAMGDGWALAYPLSPERYGHGRMRHLAESAAAMLAPPRA
jgi:TetR/AcrR family transcriptional regulator, transcriptional repressor of aconitase